MWRSFASREFRGACRHSSKVRRIWRWKSTRLAIDGEDADAAVGASFPAPISPPRRGRRSYYTLTLDIETLSLTELDEVEQWLRGEVKPAVRGKKNPGTAVGRGMRTVMVRLIGGEKRRYETRTGTFRP